MTENIKQKSINEIFHDMDFGSENTDINENKGTLFKDMIYKSLKATSIKTYTSIESCLQTAIKSQLKWKDVPRSSKADCLHKVWEALIKKFQLVSKNFPHMKNEFQQIIDYFDFYSDLALLSLDTLKEPIGVILIIATNESSFSLLSGIIAAALAAGCSLVIQLTEERSWFPLLLSDVFSEAGLPEVLCNVLSKSVGNKEQSFENINKVIYYGSFSDARDFYKKSIPNTFSFLCPGNTSAIVLESCDLNSAVDKIFSQALLKSSDMWAISTVVVQESVQKKFIQKLKLKNEIIKMENFKLNESGDETNHNCVNIVHYQNPNEDIKSEQPVLRVLICRTPKEGVALVNNSKYSLGVSVWTETSSQALEVAYWLKCQNVWINCHGVSKAEVPLQPNGFSGNCVIGGYDGILEYMHVKPDDLVDKNINSETNDTSSGKLNILQTIESTQNAFFKWSFEKNKRRYLKDAANLFKNSKEIFEIVNDCAHWGKLFNIPINNFDEEFVVCQKKIPCGVIAVFFNNLNPSLKAVASLITPAIALGNTVILGLKEDNSSVRSLVKQFNSCLPKNVLNIVTEGPVVECFASNPNIHALWLYDENLTKEYLQMIRNHSTKSLKKVWLVPKNITVTQNIFSKESLQNKVVWMTNIDQYP